MIESLLKLIKSQIVATGATNFRYASKTVSKHNLSKMIIVTMHRFGIFLGRFAGRFVSFPAAPRQRSAKSMNPAFRFNPALKRKAYLAKRMIAVLFLQKINLPSKVARPSPQGHRGP